MGQCGCLCGCAGYAGALPRCKEDVQRDTIVPVRLVDQQTIAPNVGVKQALRYNTLYLPDTVGIDTFTVAQKEIPAFTEVLITNIRSLLANMANDGSRWATLRDWISNAAVKNHNGYGGTDISGDPKIHFEAGWGAPGIYNGKIAPECYLASRQVQV